MAAAAFPDFKQFVGMILPLVAKDDGQGKEKKWPLGEFLNLAKEKTGQFLVKVYSILLLAFDYDTSC